jgi:hypothetical protein
VQPGPEGRRLPVEVLQADDAGLVGAAPLEEAQPVNTNRRHAAAVEIKCFVMEFSSTDPNGQLGNDIPTVIAMM